MKIHFEEVRKNKIRSFLLIFCFVIVIGLLGSFIGLMYDSLLFGLILSVLVAGFYTLIVYNQGNNMILSMNKAKPVTKKEYPHLFHTVEGLALAAGIPTPKAYVIEDEALNAFATGKDPEHASIVVTTGLLNKMNRQELEGVVAHEMSHIQNYDIRFMMLTAVLVGVITLISHMILRSFLWGGGKRDREGGSAALFLIVIGLVLAILTPLIGQMIKFAISRKREYMADANAVVLTRYPPGLANALKKIKEDPKPEIKSANNATAHLFISSPFKRKKQKAGLFDTHPPIEERIKILEQM